MIERELLTLRSQRRMIHAHSHYASVSNSHWQDTWRRYAGAGRGGVSGGHAPLGGENQLPYYFIRLQILPLVVAPTSSSLPLVFD